jgi:hypothetical protein
MTRAVLIFADEHRPTVTHTSLEACATVMVAECRRLTVLNRRLMVVRRSTSRDTQDWVDPRLPVALPLKTLKSLRGPITPETSIFPGLDASEIPPSPRLHPPRPRKKLRTENGGRHSVSDFCKHSDTDGD